MDAKLLPDLQILPYPPISYSHTPRKAPSPSHDPITLNISSSWTYCGPLLALDAQNLPSSFYSWAQAAVNGNILASLFSFLDFAHVFLVSNDISHYWLTVRASKGSHEFDVPRWHTDELFFSPTAQPPPSSQLSPLHKMIKAPRGIGNVPCRKSKVLGTRAESINFRSISSFAQVITASSSPIN